MKKCALSCLFVFFSLTWHKRVNNVDVCGVVTLTLGNRHVVLQVEVALALEVARRLERHFPVKFAEEREWIDWTRRNGRNQRMQLLHLYGSHVSVDVTPYRLCSITMRVCSGASISNASERHICFSNGPLPTTTPNVVVVVVGVLVVIVELEVEVDVESVWAWDSVVDVRISSREIVSFRMIVVVVKGTAVEVVVIMVVVVEVEVVVVVVSPPHEAPAFRTI